MTEDFTPEEGETTETDEVTPEAVDEDVTAPEAETDAEETDDEPTEEAAPVEE
jgi:hypothetical protein